MTTVKQNARQQQNFYAAEQESSNLNDDGNGGDFNWEVAN